MRILHLTDRLSGRGGAHQHLLAVVRAQVAAGHDVHLLAGADDGSEAAACQVTIVAGLAARERHPVDLERPLDGARPDVIHVHTVVNPAALEWAAHRGAVATVQDHRVFCPGRGKWTAGGAVCRDAMADTTCAACFDDARYFRDTLALTRERLAALARMRAVIALSRYVAGELAAVGVARVVVIPPFVDFGTAAARPDGAAAESSHDVVLALPAHEPCVLFVGRLVAAKGVADAIDAWRLAQVDLPLVFAGTGPLRERAQQAGARVLGWLPHAQLASAYRSARALLLPSRWQEPFGIAGLEALSMGVPVVAWESGGIGEWHPGPLAPWGDVEALACLLRAAVDGAPPLAPRVPGRDLLMLHLDEVYRSTS